MRKLRKLIPSPTTLIFFEAAGRHRSFSRAAGELGVTQAAVSYAIKQLEGSLACLLFQRRHRHVALTPEGERFHRDVSLGLTHILQSAEALLDKGREKHVTLSVSTAFVSHWLLPRLADFHRALPGLDLRLLTTDKDLDLGAEAIQLGIRRGGAAWDHYDAALLAREEIFAVASPAYLKGSKAGRKLQDLTKHRLIHLEEPFRPRPTWADWFQAQGLSLDDESGGLRLNDYALVLQAAVDGEGVALGWRHLVDPMIAKSALVKVVPQSLKSDFGFYVVWPKSRALSPEAGSVRDWLVTAAAAKQPRTKHTLTL